jgi:hypothetical protein
MLGVILTDQVIQLKNELKENVKKMKKEGASEREMILWMFYDFRDTRKSVLQLFDNHLELEKFTGLSHKLYPYLWQS